MRCVKCGRRLAKAAAVITVDGAQGAVGPVCAVTSGLVPDKPMRVALFGGRVKRARCIRVDGQMQLL
jgi:hypothetical protein